MSTGSELYALESTCPVPQLPWARREEFWEVMCRKDELSLKTRDPELFNFQQHLRPRMRVILLDWISEVIFGSDFHPSPVVRWWKTNCLFSNLQVAELFKLHRETYYLTVDYIDRYLSCVENIPKSQLQLIGRVYFFTYKYILWFTYFYHCVKLPQDLTRELYEM